MIIVDNIKQGSAEWLAARIGKVTASRMSAVLSKGRGDAPSKTAETYMMELIVEKLTGEPTPFFETADMKWGTETEEDARLMYQIRNNVAIREVAYISEGENLLVSPDGLVGDNGLIEIKCPKSATQLKRALTDNYSKDYTAQIQMQLWISKREWCDFLSYDPRLPKKTGYLEQRVQRDEKYIKNMSEKTNEFIDRMGELLEKLT